MKRLSFPCVAALVAVACSAHPPAEGTREVVQAESASGDYAYGFDPSGLMTSIGNGNGTGVLTITRTGDTLTAGSNTWRFDSLGRVIAIEGLSMVYGADGQIATASTGTGTLSYLYDEDGQRILKSKDGEPIAAYDGESRVTAESLQEPVRTGGKLVGLLTNGSFSLVATDTHGTVQADTDGTPRTASPFGARPVHPDVDEMADWTGKGFEPELGAERLGVRDYDPRIGRFLQPDPLFLLQPDKCVKSPVECSLYGYARSNPASYTDPTGTWSSMGSTSWFSPVQPVHQMAVENVLKGVVSDRTLQILKDAQSQVDELQGPEDQPIHSMNGEGMDRASSIQKANDYVSHQLTVARDRFTSWTGQVPLGAAIHTLQDATSPSHTGFQTYNDHFPHDVLHAVAETRYPGAGTEDRKMLEGATRWAYDIAAGNAPMPSRFFDEKSGALLLPDSYKK